MACHKKPTSFDKPQLAICKGCNMLSKAGKWCGNWGVYTTERSDDKYPPLIQQAASFGKAAVKQVAAGMPTRSAEKIAAMMRICKACPKYVAEDERCKQCGCRMPAKIKWATTNCPLKKW